MDNHKIDSQRRKVLQALAGLGIGTAAFQRAVAAQSDGSPAITTEMIQDAEWVAGIELNDEERESAARTVNRAVRDYEKLREIPLKNSVIPAMMFHPSAPAEPVASRGRQPVTPIDAAPPARPQTDEELAFLPVTELAALLRTQQITSTELTKIYLTRLRQYDPKLLCVVNLTEKLALKQAERADREIAAGHYRGPLHGIPWGAKDLIAYPGYKTTWGATPFKDQVINVKATVARRLEEAGAVLVAKLSLGALAMGDRWFRGQTRNPWNLEEGSSGSSAGSASATSAGLVGFAIGSETHGSIVSPCRRCGVSGLRPTFGRVSRFGCMTLSWSMDKIGPIARSIEDCALILGAIHGFDSRDPTTVDRPFVWPGNQEITTLKVGYFEEEGTPADRPELKTLADLGVNLTPISLPEKYPVAPLRMILGTEAATAFDEIARQGITEGLNSWPNTFRNSRFVPAVEYLKANRVRSLVMEEMERVMEKVDLYVNGDDSLLTNLTGHPTAVLPDRMERRNGVAAPGSIRFTGRLYGESALLAVANAYQRATGFHLRQPTMEPPKPQESTN